MVPDTAITLGQEYDCSIWISISVKHLFDQPVKTEESQTYKNICNAALGKKKERFWHCLFLNLSVQAQV